ncbi:MAG: hypothetical protein HY738_03070 [Bacteroidia bacterium]|nr:hypothetical protein [Bacteroidia bacterium]
MNLRLRTFLLGLGIWSLGLGSCLAQQAGDLDTAFKTGGIVTTAIGSGHNGGYSIALQKDGKILSFIIFTDKQTCISHIFM